MGTKTYNNYQDLISFSRASAGYALRPVSYGSQLVSNGDFSDDTTGWADDGGANPTASVSSGQLVLTATQTGSIIVEQSSAQFEAGKIYQIKVDVVTTTDNISVWNRASSSINISALSTGTNVINYVATESGYLRIGNLGAVFSTGEGFTLDNISVKEVTFDEVGGRLTLFEHPNDIPRIEYSLNDSKERFEGIDDQILKAAVGTEPQATEFDVLVNGQKIGDITNNGDVSAFDASQYSSWLVGSLTNQTYIDYIEDVLNPYIEANLDKYILPYPEGVDRRGLLIEEARTNLIANSDFDAGVSQSGVTITANASESPDGLENATSLDITTTGAFAYFTRSVTAGTEYTWSWFAKLGTATAHVYAVYDVTNAAFVSRAQYTLTNGENYGRGWYRHSTTFTAPTGCTEVRVYALRATDDNGYVSGATGTTFVWGGQLEADAFASSIIRTTGTSAGRSSDLVEIKGDVFGLNDKEGTMVIEFDQTYVEGGTGFPRAVELGNDATAVQRCNIYIGESNDRLTAALNTNNSNQGILNLRSGLEGTLPMTKVAFGFADDNLGASDDGDTAETDISADFSGATDKRNRITFGTSTFVGHIKSFQYYPRRLTNAQLEDLSS